ncbi:MAG: alpha-N-arabinofuranosidase [Spirochaetaceae bacterium]
MINYIINTNAKKSKINKNIYGHFSEHLGRCIYEGLFVGPESEIENVDGIRTDVVNALKNMKIPVLRWPGGCFADEYHWKDGIGPKENRKKMINTNWGGLVEDNSFGTHEFMKLCELLDCEPYINGNVGSGTVQEMSEWVEYLTFNGTSPMAKLREENGNKNPWDVKYFGVGNESWGCGGNMRPEYYADLYRQFQTYVRDYSNNKIFKIACGPNEDNYEWTDVLMSRAGEFMNGLTLHYYTIPFEWENKGSSTIMSDSDFYVTIKKTLFMEELLVKHSRIMDKHDPEKKVDLIVDEWGSWYDVEPGTNPGFLYQQNTMRDALIAGINLNIFNKHSDRVRMANIAQVVNVLQAVILTDGKKMILTPTYHVFEMFKDHQDNILLESSIDSDLVGTKGSEVTELIESASVNENGDIIITICNLDIYKEKQINTLLVGFNCKSLTGEIISGKMDDHNTFEVPESVIKNNFDNFTITDNGFEAVIPPCSIVKIVAKNS